MKILIEVNHNNCLHLYPDNYLKKNFERSCSKTIIRKVIVRKQFEKFDIAIVQINNYSKKIAINN